jgi:hypothetical protein
MRAENQARLLEALAKARLWLAGLISGSATAVLKRLSEGYFMSRPRRGRAA